MSFVVLVRPSRQIVNIVTNRTQLIPSKFLLTDDYSPLIPIFDATESEILTASLNKPHKNRSVCKIFVRKNLKGRDSLVLLGVDWVIILKYIKMCMMLWCGLLVLFFFNKVNKLKKCKAIPVTGRGGL
jgi:hypothetical protein